VKQIEVGAAAGQWKGARAP